MHKNFKTHLLLASSLLALTLSGLANAAGKTYTEDEFLTSFSGKSKKIVIEKLGTPVKKQLSVKPTNASSIIGKNVDAEKGKKPVKVEMWYYKNNVKYDKKRTYKETELTLVNDRVMNIAFFNNR
ncbi:MAG: hypothetical protein CTY37_02905 [Methylotenera sp.]|nr:MAG: hypothetical protein CTY37_02905 [Methylotenera sp.]